MTIKGDKQLTPRFHKAAGTPSAEQLGRINGYALAELKPEQVYVRTAYLAHNAIDRDREVFDDALLDDFARTLPGKGLFWSHPGGFMGDAGPGMGRWFEGRTITMSFEEAREKLREPNLKWAPGAEQAKLLETSFYFPLPSMDGLAAQIDAGVVADVSIGFRASDRTPITDADGNTIASRLLGPGEALEGSFVWLGAQPGARVHKQAHRSGENDVDKDEQIKQANSRAEKAEARAKEIEGKAGGYDAIVTALGEELAKDPQALKGVVEEGKVCRADLVERIVKAERLAGLVKGDDEATIKAARAVHEGGPLERLTAYLARVEQMAPEGGTGTVTGSDPNRTGATAGKHADPDSPLNNPAITGQAKAA